MRNLILKAALAAVACCGGAMAPARGADVPEPIAEGPFKPSWESLRMYQCPQWFADAKFGIWAHWSAQCVPGEGDWYARHLYRPEADPKSWEHDAAEHAYKFHVEHYGHPSQVGFKDVIHQWKAENWDPDELMSLYRRAGAQYFVALANHHCNFDAWDSKYHAWNSVNIGPKKDLIGGWAEAARKQNLRFGVSIHAARAWEWYEPAQGADRDGPLAGVPYDGKLTKADGKGTWWEGYDPQELYAQNHKPGEKPDKAYADQFYLRTKDLIDKYHPDLIYYDDWQLPLNQTVGLNLAAHYYNASMQWHNGENQAVMNTKGLTPEMRKAMVWDIERGKSDRIEPYPWQADTCIGGWHYNVHIYEGNGYKSANTVLCTLADIVSKNGNLLLSVPVRGDGTIDEKERKVVENIAAWMNINSQAIFGTRPWVRFGEGPATKEKAGDFNEGAARPYSARDIRFTTKDGALYAIAMAWPKDGKLTIRSLQADPKAKIASAELLGANVATTFTQDANGVHVQLPSGPTCEGPCVMKITGSGLMQYAVPELDESTSVMVPPAGAKLDMQMATLHGKRLFIEDKHPEGNVGAWTAPDEFVSWDLNVAAAGTYTAAVVHAGPATTIRIEGGGQSIEAKLPPTGAYDRFVSTPVGEMRIPAGRIVLTIKPADAAGWSPVNLVSVELGLSR